MPVSVCVRGLIDFREITFADESGPQKGRFSSVYCAFCVWYLRGTCVTFRNTKKKRSLQRHVVAVMLC